VTDDDRALWDPEAQTVPPEVARQQAAAGIERCWRRVWELPVPYYRNTYEAAGFDADHVPALDDIPRTTKTDLRSDEAEHPPWGTHRAVSLSGAVRIGASGGTTGRPTMYFYGRNDLDVHVAVVTRNMWRHGLRQGMRFTHSWPQGLYPSALGGGRSYLEIGVLEIAVGLPFSPDAAAEHLRLWSILRPDGFMMTGSQLQLYLETAERVGIDFPALLDGGIVAFLEASCQFEGPRRRVESLYGVRLRNIGGASDIPGFAVTDCAHHRGMHVAGDHFVIQVCDPVTGREVPAGERGSLVVTAFDLDAVAIRYDVEDIVVQRTGPCPCGETGPRYTLLGRRADAVELDGRTLLPLDVQLALDDLGSPEFSVVGTGRSDALRLEVESVGAVGADKRLARELAERLAVPIEVEVVEEGTLPRAKFKPRRVSA
jgi:phenylacetate-CoA ligase